MAFSVITYTADGVLTDFAVTFDYLDQSHVAVRVNKVETTAVGSLYKFEWLNATTIRVNAVLDDSAVPASSEIEFIRRTPINTPAVVFGGGAALSSENLNKNSEYLTYALQEATDANEEFTKLYLGSFTTAPTLDNDGEALQVGAVYYDSGQSALFYWTGSEWIIGESTAAAETARLAAEAAQAAAEAAQAAAEAAKADAENQVTLAANQVTLAQSAKDQAETAAGNAAASAAAAAASEAAVDPSQFMTKETATFSGDLNTVSEVRFLFVNAGATNAPTANAGTLEHVQHPTDGNFAAQSFIDNSTGILWTRKKQSGTWTAWLEVGSASGGGGGGSFFKGNNGDVGEPTGVGDIFRVNTDTLTSDVTIAAGENAQATGPITVANGVTLTINGNLAIT